MWLWTWRTSSRGSRYGSRPISCYMAVHTSSSVHYSVATVCRVRLVGGQAVLNRRLGTVSEMGGLIIRGVGPVAAAGAVVEPGQQTLSQAVATGGAGPRRGRGGGRGAQVHQAHDRPDPGTCRSYTLVSETHHRHCWHRLNECGVWCRLGEGFGDAVCVVQGPQCRA